MEANSLFVALMMAVMETILCLVYKPKLLKAIIHPKTKCDMTRISITNSCNGAHFSE